MTKRAGSIARRLEAAWLRRGPLAVALLPLSAVYGLLVATRRLLYARQLLARETLSVPVLVVGNLIAGGAGKTPTVLACVALLRSLGYTPGIISRGYRPRSDDLPPSSASSHQSSPSASEQPADVTFDSLASLVGDEPLLLRLRSRAPVVIGADRVAAGQALLRLHPEVNVVVSDDGLQHLRLARDAAIIVFDERGAGNGWLLPAGPLREPLPATLPPRTIALYNAPTPSTALPGHAARPVLAGAAPLAAWWAGEAPSRSAFDLLRGRSLLAMAGVARPERFFSMLEREGLQIERLALPDHYGYANNPWPDGTADLIVTEKDAVKLRPERIGSARVWVVALDFEPEPAFLDAMRDLFPPRHSDRDLHQPVSNVSRQQQDIRETTRPWTPD